MVEIMKTPMNILNEALTKQRSILYENLNLIKTWKNQIDELQLQNKEIEQEIVEYETAMIKLK